MNHSTGSRIESSSEHSGHRRLGQTGTVHTGGRSRAKLRQMSRCHLTLVRNHIFPPPSSSHLSSVASNLSNEYENIHIRIRIRILLPLPSLSKRTRIPPNPALPRPVLVSEQLATMSDLIQEMADVPREFFKDGTQFIHRCTKRT